MAVYVSLLCSIYENGYYAGWDDDMPFIISEMLPGYDEVYILEVVKYCLRIGLFDAKMMEEHGVLTSAGIQRRYMEVQQQYRRNSVIEEYSLISDEATAVNAAKTAVNATLMGVIAAKTPINAAKSTQKENKRKENKSLSDDKHARGRAPANQPDGKRIFAEEREKEAGAACEGKKGAAVEAPADGEHCVNDLMEVMRGDTGWLKSMAERMRCTLADVMRALADFETDCETRGRGHSDLVDAKRHFVNWLGVKQRNGKLLQQNDDGRNRQRTAAVEPACCSETNGDDGYRESF